MTADGVTFVTNTEVGKDYPAEKLLSEFDAVVPAEESRRAAPRLKAAGFAVEARFFPRLGHSISGEGVEAAGTFLARALKPA